MSRRATATAVTTLAALALSACTLATESSDEKAERSGDSSDRVVLVTHESFSLPKRLEKRFERDTGLTLDVRPSGDAGALTNKLVLTQGNPIGDVAFGVDNTFASRALDEDVFAPYDAPLPDGAGAYALDDGGDRLAPVDQASVCVNVDTAWYHAHDQQPPRTLDDLTDPAYRDQLVVPGAPTSSPGMAFLLATIAAYGEDGWADYWSRLMANGAKLTSGWNDAYFVDFTGGAEKGARPIVVSYDTSPAFTIDKATGRSTTAALLDTCFRQVEYAGVLENATNPEGAAKVVDFLLSDEVQAALPDSMYVFPVASGVALPEAWERFAVTPDDPYAVDPATVAEHRQDWLTEWTDVTSR
jgi:thiamine transport system substrate-binding protein